MKEILEQDSFVCHKTLNNELKQCAGHMLLAPHNSFADLAARLGIALDLEGKTTIFPKTQDCINHHNPHTNSLAFVPKKTNLATHY